MIRLSVNVLLAIGDMLQSMEMTSFASVRELSYLRLSQIDSDDLFSLACRCGWARVDDVGRPTFSDRGITILNAINRSLHTLPLRLMLTDYIFSMKPAWAYRIPSGRKEATILMSKDEIACFSEAGLLIDPPTPEIVEWWDSIAGSVRSEQNERKLQTGRVGEKLTVEYELCRTGKMPKWISIDSNFAGYDIISQQSSSNPAPLLIEAKSSTEALETAVFYLSSYEWTVASTQPNYRVYLWLLYGSTKMLATLCPAQIEPFIPHNNNPAKWESVSIPFRCFQDNFVSVQ